MTCDLEAIASWLLQAKITTVAIESTGVYWKSILACSIKKGLKFTWSIPGKQKMYPARKQMKAMPDGYKNYTVAVC